MKKIYVLSVLTIIVFTFSFSKKLFHGPDSSGGITGRTVSGCTCHGPLATPGVVVNLTGVPANPIVGTTYDLVLSVTSPDPGNNPSAGFDLAADAGTLNTAVIPDGAQESNGELIHTSPKVLAGNTATWNVRWTPDAVGPVTFTFAGNNVNSNGGTGGDFWNTGSLNTTVVLPVTLTSFNAIRNTDNEIKLIWKVEQEINFKQYIVERSCNGITYESVGTIAPTANTTIKEYNYIDKTSNCNTEKIFYRLKIEDLDASFKYSPIVSVTAPSKEDLPYIFPNPASKNLSSITLYVGKTAPQNIQLYDNNGLLLYTNNKLSAYENKITLPSNVKPGNYYFKINYKNNAAGKVVRFIIN
ncbi:MAG: T9SS type A sorting domain-containing protein [Chitinophagaceae bacterium]|nr:T9SS type A sorting domain-containing protein [Chitinophagaceae bacterium]